MTTGDVLSVNNIATEVNKSNSIESRLMLIMSLFVTLFICATLAGWALSSKLRYSQETLIQRAMPALKDAQHRISTTLQLLDLSIQLSSPQHQAMLKKIEARIPLIMMEVETANKSAPSSSPLSLLTTNINDQLAIQKKISTLTRELIDKRQYELDKIDGILLRLRSIFSEAALKKTTKNDFKRQSDIIKSNNEIQSLTELRFEVQAIRGIITAMTPNLSAEQSAALKQNYQAILQNISLKLSEFSTNNRALIAKKVEKLYETLSNTDSIFNHTLSLSKKRERLNTISTTSIEYSEKLRKQAIYNHQQATEGVDSYQENVRQLMAFSLYFWGILAFIATAFSFISLSFYIRPYIINRLRRITSDTKMIANGEYDIAISVDGKDEITLIAASLEHFRNQLIAKERFQKDLEEREAYLSSIYQNAKDGLFTIDKNGKILSINSSFEKIFEINAKNVVNRSIEPFLPNINIIQKLTQAEERNSSTGDAIITNEEIITHRSNGSSFYANLSIGVIMPDNTRLFSCFIRDITEQKNAKEQLNQVIEKLTESNGELERFASSCSHDLQEPMRMVATYSELLEVHLNEQLDGNVDEKTKKYLDFIQNGSSSARQLITGILQYSRLGQQGMEKKWINLDSLFSRVAELAEALIIEKSATLTWHANEISIYGVESPLFQLFLNLISNGIKFNHASTPCVHIEVEDQGEVCLISVRDNGIGIDPNYHGQIFDIFKRLNSKREFDGSGIGLAICSKVVKKSGGRIWLESELGKGTCFYICLPKKNQ